MRGARPYGVPPNEFRPPNLYYDHGNARQTFHPPTGLQTAIGYNSIQNRPRGPQSYDNRRQVPPTDPGSTNSQDVRFMDGIRDPHHDEYIFPQVAFGEEQSQWPRHTNAITYELRSLDDGVTHEAPALAVITSAMRGNIQAEKDGEKHEEYSSDQGPHLLDL
jgi:hypothetical protein